MSYAHHHPCDRAERRAAMARHRHLPPSLHQRANQQTNRGGGIIEKESYIDISNVQLIDPQSGKPTRVKYHVEGDGTKTRMAAGSGHSIEK